MIDVEAVKGFREWVIEKAVLAARLHEEFKEVDTERIYVEGSLGAYHDVRVELDRFILSAEESN